MLLDINNWFCSDHMPGATRQCRNEFHFECARPRLLFFYLKIELNISCSGFVLVAADIVYVPMQRMPVQR